MMRKCLLVSLAISLSFVSCRYSSDASFDDGSLVRGEAISCSYADYYVDSYSPDEFVDVINEQISENGKILPIFPGYKKYHVNQVEFEYVDKREDMDADGDWHDTSLPKRKLVVFGVGGEKSFLPLADPDERSGYDFVGWRIDAKADCGVDVEAGIVKFLRKHTKNMNGPLDDLVEYLKGTGKFDETKTWSWDSLNYRIFQPGDDIEPYYKNVICAFFGAENYDSATMEYAQYPFHIVLHAVWKPSACVRLEYCDDVYDAGTNAYISVKLPVPDGMSALHRDMYPGAPYFGAITSFKPEKKGYVFGGWEDRENPMTINDANKDSQATINHFMTKYGDGDVCRLYPIWNSDGTAYLSSENRFITLAGSGGFGQKFAFIPQGVHSFCTAGYGLEPASIDPDSFSISLNDVSGAQIVSLINANATRKWGFDTLEYLNPAVNYEQDIADDYWYDDRSVLVKMNENEEEEIEYDFNKIVVSGARIDYSGCRIRNAGNSTDYPAVLITLPQAMLICNMFTAAYNECHPNAKLTYAYALELTDDVMAKNEVVVKRLTKAFEYIENSSNTHLSLDGATGFRLPRDYEYELASSIVPSGQFSWLTNNRDKFLGDASAFPVFVKKASSFPDSVFGLQSGSSYINRFSMDKVAVSDGKYTNPLGMVHATGNVRKWLETKVASHGNLMSISGGYDPGTRITVKLKMKGGRFDYATYADNKKQYNPTNWFSKLADNNITANVKYANNTGDKLYVEFVLGPKGAKVNEFSSDLTIPKALVLEQDEDLVMKGAVKISIYGTDIHYMVRSGSFMQTDVGEGEVHKCYDAVPDLRKSSSPFNYAFYDLGMRLARSI